MASRGIQDDELSSQDNFSLCSSTHPNHGTPNDLKGWSLSDVDALDSGAMSKPESPEVQMLSFSFSQQLLPSTVGPSDVMYHHAGSDFSGIQDVTEQNDLDFSHAHDFNHYSSLVDLSAFDNEVYGQNGTQSSCTPDDTLSSHSSHADDGHLAGNEAWNSMNYHGSSMDQYTTGMFQSVPVSPPLSDASNDVSVTSSCSASGYPTFMSHEDAMLKDVTTTPVGSHGINLGAPLFPLTPPLSEQDPNRLVFLYRICSCEQPILTPNRTIRATKNARRPALQTSMSQTQVKQDPEFFPPLPVKETLRQKAKEGSDLRNPRDHPYYSLPTHSDGKYYCPFANGEKPCNHPPTTQKCAYQ